MSVFNKLSAVKALIKRRSFSPVSSYFDEKIILDKLQSCDIDISKLAYPLILFMPEKNYWVLLTIDRVIYYMNNKIENILLSEITNEIFYERKLKEVIFSGKKITIDFCVLEYKKQEVKLPIEVGTAWSFCDAITFITRT